MSEFQKAMEAMKAQEEPPTVESLRAEIASVKAHAGRLTAMDTVDDAGTVAMRVCRALERLLMLVEPLLAVGEAERVKAETVREQVNSALGLEAEVAMQPEARDTPNEAKEPATPYGKRGKEEYERGERASPYWPSQAHCEVCAPQAQRLAYHRCEAHMPPIPS